MGWISFRKSAVRRYWIGALNNEKIVDIGGDLFHPICGVCRHEVGSKFELLTDDGRALFVELIEVKKKSAVAKTLDVRKLSKPSKPDIHLCVGLSKYSTMDFIVEKSVELGVHSVHPFVSDFSAIKKLSKVSDNKQQRWKKIVIGATQQSGRGNLMPVERVISLNDLFQTFSQAPNKLGIFLYEGESVESLKALLKQTPLNLIDEAWVFIGSEGGFSDKEVTFFKENGLSAITLGEQVRRTETACLSVASIVRYEVSADLR